MTSTHRGTGLGVALTEAALDLARSRRLESVTLLTTTTADYFPRFGFQPIDPAAAMQVELNPEQAAS